MIRRLIHRLTYIKESIIRFFVYGRNGYNSFDFDCSYFYKDTHLRLSRGYDLFKNNGHLMWNSNIDHKGMRKLRECILLAERLDNNEFTSKYVYEVMDKWDRLGGCSLSNINDEDLTDEQRDQYRKEFRRASKKDQIIYRNQRKRFFYLLEKYLNGWWD